jgi:hypothetical protein
MMKLVIIVRRAVIKKVLEFEAFAGRRYMRIGVGRHCWE